MHPGAADSGGKYASSGAGKRCGGHGQCVLSGPRGLRGGGGRPSGWRCAGNQLCQRRAGLPRLCLALGRAGHPAESLEMAAAAPCPVGDPAHRRPRAVPVDGADAAQLYRRPLCDQQGAHGAPGRVQSRLPRRAARRDRPHLRRAPARHHPAVPQPGAGRCRSEGHHRAGAGRSPL
ncbi:hypothetical protein D3C78_1165300 [compost metagenome]